MNHLHRAVLFAGIVLLLWADSGVAQAATRNHPRVFKAHVTEYSSLDSCTTKACIMANGLSAKVGYAACPTRYRLGTKVRINDVVYTCGDRTAKRFDGRFDIFAGYGHAAHRKAVLWGLRTETVEVLN